MKKFVTFILCALALLMLTPSLPGKEMPFILPLFALLFILPSKNKYSRGTIAMGIDVEVWKKYIIEKLRKTNDFIFLSKDDSSYVLGGAVVHIPQAGADPVIVKNRSSYPAVAVTRSDTDVTYILDRYDTTPTHIPWADLQTISYNKLDSVLGTHTAAMGETLADDLLIKWSPASTEFIRTTGGPQAVQIAGVGTQTGNRFGFHPKDLQKAMIRMNVAKVPKKGRIAMIDDNMYEYFYDALTDQQSNTFNQFAKESEGIVGRLHGFAVMTRSTVLEYLGSDTVKALNAASAADNNLASLCWHPDFVCRAFGEMKPFQDKDNALYYGDLYSMITRGGGRKERADNVGAYAIVQGVPGA